MNEKLPWSERVGMLSIHPDAATRHDIARLAADLMYANAEIQRLKEAITNIRLKLLDRTGQ